MAEVEIIAGFASRLSVRLLREAAPNVKPFPPQLLVLLLLAGCAPPARDGRVPAIEPTVDPLFADFLDGKMDAAGHPIGAQVFAPDAGCETTTGWATDDSWMVVPGWSSAGALCTAQTQPLGPGRYSVNVRALVEDLDGDAEAPVLVIRALDGDRMLAEREVTLAAFERPYLLEDVALSFSKYDTGPVSFEVSWPGDHTVRFQYAELFRNQRRLIVEPRSGVLEPGSTLTFELVDPPAEAALELRCGGSILGDDLDALQGDGLATDQTTDFRRLVEADADTLLGECPWPRRVVARTRGRGWGLPISEAWYMAAPPACTFEEGRTRVLITGFVPFPAGARDVNSSQLAVEGFDPSDLRDVSVMRIVLPVEYETASAIVAEVMERCEPDVVIGFGQGRDQVDVERIAYNVKDTGAYAGGFPDNRGVVRDGQAIADDGPAELYTGLPADAILDDLDAAGIRAGPSDDPGRYICNNVFYGTVLASRTDQVSGFVHLPRIFRPTDRDRSDLQTVVHTVVSRAVEALSDRR